MRSWPDHLIHPALHRRSDLHSRARLTVVLSLVLMVTAIGYAAFYQWIVGFGEGARILAAGSAGAVVVLPMLRVRPWLHACGHLLTAVLYGVVLALVGHEGGLASLATPWLATPPIFAILLLGRRGAGVWAALCLLTLVGLYVAESRGVHFPVRYPDAWATRLTLGSHAGLVLCTAILLFVFEDIRAGAQARAESASAALARLAYHDALTGLANRARFRDCLEAAVARARADGDVPRVAVLLIDLDGFKAVNDTLGHAAGDALLAQVGDRLLNATRGRDTVARLGGDEFAVLLDGVTYADEADVVARRIVGALTAPFTLGAREARIGASVGLARGPDGDDTLDAPAVAAAVLHDADLAMYHAKALGGSRWIWIAQVPTPADRGAGVPLPSPRARLVGA